MTKVAVISVLALLDTLGKKTVSATEQEYITSDDELSYNDEIFLFMMFSFFAFCVSVSGSFLLFIAYLDDKIMQRYMEEGELVDGEVVATEFTRGVDTGVDDTNFSSSQKEYFVSIEYTHNLSANYPVWIRKQLRVLEGDFFHPGQRPPGCDLHNPGELKYAATNKTVISSPKTRIQIIDTRDSFFKSFQFDHGKLVQLLVIPNHHLSAFPARQVQRRLSTRYRLYSISFVVATILISIFCFRLSLPILQKLLDNGSEEVDDYTPSTSLIIYCLCAMLALAPIPCIYHTLHGPIQESLQNEYFEMGADVVRGGQDDSSLSSMSEFGYNRMDLETQSTFATWKEGLK